MSIQRIPALAYNLATEGDSYKWSHWNQYPPGTTQMMSYFESRGGPFEECTLFGLQYILHRYLTETLTQTQVDEAADFARAHGEPFHHEGWSHIARKYGGRLPVTIRAIAEGTVVPTHNALLTIACDDPQVFWLVSWLETMLVRLWYPSTIAITSRASKKVLLKYLQLSSDDPEAEIGFKLHDFGARGVTSLEQARLGGAAHLLSFFGSDTIEGIRFANHYYHCKMAGFSIPASEHSTVSMWGKQHEYEMYEKYIDSYLSPASPGAAPRVAACVSDSFDIFKATHAWSTSPLLDKLKASGGTLVIRPDSGDPLQVLPEMLATLANNLSADVATNRKGYKLLPPYLRIIQGDGIDMQSMEAILEKVTGLGWSASNIAFGSGGGLLQKVNRDTQKWAFKCCEAKVNGRSVDVRKDPITDPQKRSKAGRLDLIREEDGSYRTVALEPGQEAHPRSVMRTVFAHGEILVDTNFEECRARFAL